MSTHANHQAGDTFGVNTYTSSCIDQVVINKLIIDTRLTFCTPDVCHVYKRLIIDSRINRMMNFKFYQILDKVFYILSS